MKERPILFSGSMVRAILDGTKTQTRRIVRLPADLADCDLSRAWVDPGLGSGSYLKAPMAFDETVHRVRCPFGVPGDRLYVRETWCPSFAADDDSINSYCYAATNNGPEPHRWRPSIHMPRAASRIILEVVSVRVERLRATTEEDARAEGVNPFPLDSEGDCWTDGKYKTAFQYLWNEINGWEGDASWESNPWVWVVEFKKVEVSR